MSGMVVGFRLGLCGRRSGEGANDPLHVRSSQEDMLDHMDESQLIEWADHNQRLGELSMIGMKSRNDSMAAPWLDVRYLRCLA